MSPEPIFDPAALEAAIQAGALPGGTTVRLESDDFQRFIDWYCSGQRGTPAQRCVGYCAAIKIHSPGGTVEIRGPSASHEERLRSAKVKHEQLLPAEIRAGVGRSDDAYPRCDCGGESAGTPHSVWCSQRRGQGDA